jgi:hypothetical protein
MNALPYKPGILSAIFMIFGGVFALAAIGFVIYGIVRSHGNPPDNSYGPLIAPNPTVSGFTSRRY